LKKPKPSDIIQKTVQELVVSKKDLNTNGVDPIESAHVGRNIFRRYEK
jgi:hypothetical protein